MKIIVILKKISKIHKNVMKEKYENKNQKKTDN